jgi:hypothetical protein
VERRRLYNTKRRKEKGEKYEEQASKRIKYRFE